MCSLSIVGYSRNGNNLTYYYYKVAKAIRYLVFFSVMYINRIFFNAFYYIYSAIQLLMFFLDTPESLSCRLGNSIAVS